MASFLGSAWSTVNNALESDAWRAVKDGANTVTTAAAATVSAVAAQVEEKTSDVYSSAALIAEKQLHHASIALLKSEIAEKKREYFDFFLAT